MNFSSEKPNREPQPTASPRLHISKYDPPLFFVTFCTAQRQKLLANAQAHRAFAAYARQALAHEIAVGRYVIMPDHIHLFVASGRDFDLGVWVRGLKRVVAVAVTGQSRKRFCRWDSGSYNNAPDIENPRISDIRWFLAARLFRPPDPEQRKLFTKMGVCAG